MELSRTIRDFDAQRYATALHHLAQLAPRPFVERAVELSVILGGVDRMEPLIDVMRDLYVQLRNKQQE